MPRYMNDCWPNPEQSYLLNAVLKEGDASVTAWEDWTKAVDFNDIDYGSQRLIPLLYTKLMGFGIEHPMMAYYKGLYRNFWLKNQLLFKAAHAVVKELNEAQIDVLLHKGLGVVLACGLNPALRPMDDVDFIVHRQNAQRAIDIMRKLGWQTRFDYPADLDLIHAYSFQNRKGQSIDVHWYTLDTDLTSRQLEGYWQRSFSANFEGLPIRVMDVTDQLVHTLVHGIRWSRIPAIRWVVDVKMLIEKSCSTIDWDHLVDLTKILRVSLPVLQGLGYLKEKYQVTIPDHILQYLADIPTTPFQRWEFSLVQKKRHPLLGPLVYNKKFFDYLKFHRKKFRFPGYLRYLQQMWGVSHLWQVPFEGIRRILGNTRKESAEK